jgi:hypothetical protein
MTSHRIAPLSRGTRGACALRFACAWIVTPLVLAMVPLVVRAQLELVQTIEMPDVTGRLDHLAIDATGQTLFVAALGAGEVEVVDLKAGRMSTRLRGLREPQGVAYLEKAQRLLVANGAGATLSAFEGNHEVAAVGELDDADNIRVDRQTDRVYVGYASALAVVDPQRMRAIERFALPGHPEAFELATRGPQIYVNVPTAKRIVVIDRRSGSPIASWDVSPASRNFPMALDEANHRLFIATRQPATLQVYDVIEGRRIAVVPLCSDADDLFLDSVRGQVYAICGAGQVDVLRSVRDRFELVQRIRTSSGARTGLFVPSLQTLFVAAPSLGDRSAVIQVFRIR